MSAVSGRTNGENRGLTESCRHADEGHKLIMSGAVNLEIADDRLALPSASGTCGHAAVLSTYSSCPHSYSCQSAAKTTTVCPPLAPTTRPHALSRHPLTDRSTIENPYTELSYS